MNAKCINAVLLYHSDQEFARDEMNIIRQNMVNWMILLAGKYLSLLWDYFIETITPMRRGNSSRIWEKTGENE